MALLQLTLAPAGKSAVFVNSEHITSLTEVLIPGPEVISTTKISFSNGHDVQ